MIVYEALSRSSCCPMRAVAREVILPEAITEDDRAQRTAAVVGGREGPSNDGPNAKRRKEIGGHRRALEPRRLAFADHVHGEAV